MFLHICVICLYNKFVLIINDLTILTRNLEDKDIQNDKIQENHLRYYFSISLSLINTYLLDKIIKN
jgi:hypothetical protein